MRFMSRVFIRNEAWEAYACSKEKKERNLRVNTNDGNTTNTTNTSINKRI